MNREGSNASAEIYLIEPEVFGIKGVLSFATVPQLLLSLSPKIRSGEVMSKFRKCLTC